MSNVINFIKRELVINQPIEKVWQAITDPNELSTWFGSAAQFELTENAEGFFEWQEECEGRFAMKIASIQKPGYFAWHWMYEADIPFCMEQATLVEWTLRAAVNGKTHLILIESGFKEETHRKMNIQGWLQELGDLERYLQ